MSGLKLFILTLVLFVYLLLGAVVFHFLEQDNEDVTRFTLHDVRRRILEEHQCLDEASLEVFMQAVIAARDSGIMLVGNQTSPTNWDFSSAFFFSGTVVTTIGYGNISPSTRGGQAFTIFYALLGIPLCAVVLAKMGTKVNGQLKSSWARLKALLERHALPDWMMEVIRITLGLLTLLLIFILVPAGVFTAVEGWDYHESFYYCFVTLTTIGFGDYVIGTNSDINYTWVYKWLAYVWIFLGLVVMATVIGMVSDLLSERAESMKIGRRGDRSGDGGREAEEAPPNSAEELTGDKENGKNGQHPADIELKSASGKV